MSLLSSLTNLTPFSHLPSYNPLILFKMTGLINYQGFSLSETPSLQGKVAVITGGQAGIGREVTAQLLLHGIEQVYILARNEYKYNDALKEWSEQRGIATEDGKKRSDFIKCDLSDIEDVRRVADELLSKLDRLDILINNAGKRPFLTS